LESLRGFSTDCLDSSRTPGYNSKMRLILLFFPIFIFYSANASIPRTKTVLERLAKTQGNGSYVVELELQVPKGSGFVTVQETWVIKDNENFRMSASADNEVFFTASYKGGQVQRQGLGLPSNSPMSPEFFENLFHARSGALLGRQLIAKKAISPQAFEARKPFNLKTPKYDADPFINWTKVSNQFFLGIGTTPNDAQGRRVWLEPDKFYVRKIRLSSNAEMTAERYEPYPKGLFYPRERTITYGNKFGAIKTVSLRARGDSGGDDGGGQQPVSSKIRDPQWTEALAEFYSRFR